MPIKFYCSWTKVDPVFQEYDSEANILLSPAIISPNWDVRLWSKLPNSLYIDSGIYTNREVRSDIDYILNKQLQITKNLESIPVYYSHPDLLLPKEIAFSDQTKLINKNLARAAEYIRLFKREKVNGFPVGVIHGLNPDSLYLSYQSLFSYGYRHFAIGSMSLRIRSDKPAVKRVLDFLKEFDVKPLHVLGLMLPIIEGLDTSMVTSFDTSAPIKLAHNGSVLYPSPLKRYIIRPDTYNKLRTKIYSFRQALVDPLPCNCPVCEADPTNLIGPNTAIYRNNRAIHNYFVLKWELTKTHLSSITL